MDDGVEVRWADGTVTRLEPRRLTYIHPLPEHRAFGIASVEEAQRAFVEDRISFEQMERFIGVLLRSLGA